MSKKNYLLSLYKRLEQAANEFEREELEEEIRWIKARMKKA